MSLGLEVLLMTIFIMVVSLLIVRVVFMISDSKRPRLFLITFLFLLTYSLVLLSKLFG